MEEKHIQQGPNFGIFLGNFRYRNLGEKELGRTLAENGGGIIHLQGRFFGYKLGLLGRDFQSWEGWFSRRIMGQFGWSLSGKTNKKMAANEGATGTCIPDHGAV
ncbi:hypothetical protein Fot_19997 [Forsythia ovata]|uniref:Uncharacterized protein n=1 Tax=Forsythia ovata TaxID=205694 RepID=A0ABD1VMP0_9LAMI